MTFLKFSDLDECDSEPCQNAGMCIDSLDSFTCECEEGYTGSLCETGEMTVCLLSVEERIERG